MLIAGSVCDLEYRAFVKGGVPSWQQEYRQRPRVYKGTAGGRAFQFGAATDDQTAADTNKLSGSVSTGAATFSFIQVLLNQINLEGSTGRHSWQEKSCQSEAASQHGLLRGVQSDCIISFFVLTELTPLAWTGGPIASQSLQSIIFGKLGFWSSYHIRLTSACLWPAGSRECWD